MIHATFETSAGSESANTWFVQGMHTLSPRWYVAARREATKSPLRGAGIVFAAHQNLESAEATIGFRLTPTLTFKGGWSASRSYGATDWTHHAGIGLVWNQRWR